MEDAADHADSPDTPESFHVITFEDVKRDLTYAAEFLMSRGQPPESTVIRKLLNGGVFGATVLKMAVLTYRMTFEDVVSHLHEDVRLSEQERETLRGIFSRVNVWAQNT